MPSINRLQVSQNVPLNPEGGMGMRNSRPKKQGKGLHTVTEERDKEMALDCSSLPNSHGSVVSDAIVVVKDGLVSLANSSAVALFGARTEQELIGVPITRLASESENRAITDLFEQGVSGDQCVDQCRFVTLAGDEFHATFSSIPLAPGPGNGMLILHGKRAIQGNLHLLELMADFSALGMLIVEEHSNEILYFNQRFCELWRIDSSWLDGKPAMSSNPAKPKYDVVLSKCLSSLEDAEAYRASTLAMANFADRISIADEVVLKDRRTLHRYSAQIRDRFDCYRGRFHLFEEITSDSQEHLKLMLSRDVFLNAMEGIMITDANGLILEVNDAFTRITGYESSEVVGNNPRLLSSGRHDRGYYEDMWRCLLTQGHWQGEIWNRRKSGEVYAEELSIRALKNANGIVQYFVALFTDISERKRSEHKLEQIIHFDGLTNLPNRALFADRLNRAMAQADRRKTQVVVVLLDLDDFKQINDLHGHETGDQILVTLARRLLSSVREIDTVARMGGDEFMVVLTDLEDLSTCPLMLSRLLDSVFPPIRQGEKCIGVTASLGVTFYPQANEIDADQLVRQATQALYLAKVSGKNRYQIFDGHQDRQLRSYHDKMNQIKAALEHNEFVLHYQPKVNMRMGKVTGVEALIRWHHPHQGLLLPGAFLPTLQNHPLAITLGEWVIDTAMGQIEAWHAIGLSLPISVNVDAFQLQQRDFVERLKYLLSQHPKVQPGFLEIEVLETSALEDFTWVSQIMEECAALGVSFALDDFGTGYSSLTYLKKLAAATIKIDQSFVCNLVHDVKDCAILQGVISMAAAFQREVIAEGVETVAHGKLLLQLGCENAQGYGIAKPMPAERIVQWLQEWKPDPGWSL